MPQSSKLRARQPPFQSFIEKAFLIDLRRDCHFYDLPEVRRLEMERYYTHQELLANCLSGYLNLSFMRGCSSLLNRSQHSWFIQQSLCELLPSLTVPDPFFILPLVSMPLTYLILRRSRHPYLIHLVRDQNKLHCWNISFMVGISLIFPASVFQLGYIGLAMGHLLVRAGKIAK